MYRELSTAGLGRPVAQYDTVQADTEAARGDRHPRTPRRARGAGTEPRPLVTSRNNSYPPAEATPFRFPRAYVQACGKGTLGLFYEGSRVVFGALACGSWSCPHCRKRLAARKLDQLRRGMESRPGMERQLVTLTVDPARFGAVRIGTAFWDSEGNPARSEREAVRTSALWSEPNPEQFRAAVKAMSTQWDLLNQRLKAKARRAGAEPFGYFRVIELHRNGWPHYHVVLEHPEWGPEDVQLQLAGWNLGRTDARGISLDDAVGELAPYLVCNERKSGGHKAYQFAANALPEGFRLYSSSRGFCAPPIEQDGPKPIHGVPLRGHFAGYHQAVKEMGADARLVLYPPSDGDHVPPARTIATGDAAVVYYAELVHQAAMHAEPRWMRPVREMVSTPAPPDPRRDSDSETSSGSELPR